MDIVLTDIQIAELIVEPKILPDRFRSRLQLKGLQGDQNMRASLVVEGAKGSPFVIKLRQNKIDPMDFSAILMYTRVASSSGFRLRRYNGPHEHENYIERELLDCHHIHQATERYQAKGYREDHYAEPSDRYYDIHAALQCLLDDCCFIYPEGSHQGLLF